MNAEEYAAQQAVISAAIARFVLQFTKFFQRPLLDPTQWIGLLELLFPEVSNQRFRSAEIARTFYDSQRLRHHPDLPRNEQFLVRYDFERFVSDMEPARKRMSQEDSHPNASSEVALVAVRAVENAGRQQIIRAVEQESEPGVLRGWARVATGRETCAWCLMLVSRGPTYMGADTSGLDLDDTSALQLFNESPDIKTYFESIQDHMEEWHIGCDCKVIPVFKSQDWHGRAASERALGLWKDATVVAEKLRLLDPNRVHLAGKKKGKPFTLNEDVINVLRGMLSEGDITAADYAGIAA